jgi:large subunit ribosomal protein L10
MNREQKSAAIAEIASHIDEADAIFAVDYRGISVAEVAELRAKLRDADATFKVVKNSLTERAADQTGAEQLKEHLEGPTALTFVRGDAAVAAKAVADFARTTQLLPFKGGMMDGEPLDADQIRALSRLPAREVLYGQLVGIVASPVGGLVRSLAGLLGGLASALGQVRDKKESGEIPAGDAPAPPEAEAPAEPEAEAAATDEAPAEPEAEAAEAASEEEPAAEEPEAEAAPADEPAAEEPEAEAPAEDAPAAEADQTAEPEGGADADADASEQTDDNQADVSADDQPEDAETNPKED